MKLVEERKLALDTKVFPLLNLQPGLKSWLAAVSTSTLRVSPIRRVAFAVDDPAGSGLSLIMVERLENELHLDGVDEFQASRASPR